MKETLTPKQVARAIGVSEASLKRWCDKGLLPTTRTLGGHRRLPLAGVIQFIREQGHEVVRPEVLGLPVTSGQGTLALARAARGVREGLAEGDEERVRGAVFNLYLAQHRLTSICDNVLAPAMAEMGTSWEHGDAEVYEERLACEISLRLLHEFRLMLPTPPLSAPLAIGGTLSTDPYMLATAMVEVILRDAGWRAESLGVGLPTETLRAAIAQRRPRLVWFSLSTPESVNELRGGWSHIRAEAESVGALVVVGGRALTDRDYEGLEQAVRCDSVTGLASLAQALHARERNGNDPATQSGNGNHTPPMESAHPAAD
ncbi:MAG: cobalamin-dependent protein [Phycisphaerae bacterium]|nr:cobalamin-dependent protein [Phycisphaerae bacterium]